MADTTSPALAAEGTLLQMGNGISPESWQTVANVGDISGPQFGSTIVDITSHSSQVPFRQKIPTLLDIGNLTFPCFWVMTNPTHMNALTGGFPGIRYAYFNRELIQIRLKYTDGTSSDIINCYVTQLGQMAAVAGVYTMNVQITGTGSPVQFT